MTQTNQSGMIPVQLVGMDDKKAAILRMAFKMYAAANYVIAEPGQTAQAAIVDIDNNEGMQTWRNFKAAHPQLPALLASIQEPEDESIPYLPKPIKVETLFPVLREVLSGRPVTRTKSAANQNRMVTQSEKEQERLRNQEPAAPRFVRSQELAENELGRFSVSEGILGHLIQASRQKSDAAIVFQGKPVILVFNSIGRAILTVSPDELKKFCAAPQAPLEMKLIPDNPQWKERAKLSIASLLWQSALWSANGRLLKEIDAKTPLTLAAWPNLTRLAHISDAIRMSAFMSQTNTNLSVMYRLMNVELTNLLNFIAANYVVGTLKTGEAALASPIFKNRGIQPEKDQAQTEAIQPRFKGQSTNMLQMLMNRLSTKQ